MSIAEKLLAAIGGRSRVAATALLLCAALAGAPMGAAAARIWRFPGHMCRFYDPLGDDHFFDPGGWGANGLKNTSGNSKHVTCPILMVSDPNARIKGAAFHVSSVSGDCDILRRLSSGGGVQWYAWTSKGNDPSPQNDPSFYWNWGGAVLDCTNATCSFYCSIPGGVGINSYQYSPE